MNTQLITTPTPLALSLVASDELPDWIGCPRYDDLCPSTNTIMAYSNHSFDLKGWFKNIPITSTNVYSTRKKNNIDKKTVAAPAGSIIGVHFKNKYRGLNLKKQKKHWCEVTCRLTLVKATKEDLINTVVEQTYHIQGDTYGKKYYCENCNQEYTIKQLKKIAHFLNQLTISIVVGSGTLLNIMVFRGDLSCMKIAGCKFEEDAIDATLLLWNHFGLKNYATPKFDEPPKFVYKSVMTNVDFKLDFPIDRVALNLLMNSPEYAQVVYCSYYESTSRANVNIKMYKAKPEGYYFDCLVIPPGEEPYFTKLPSNPYKKFKNKSKDTKYTTFIVFSSSKIILSGKYKQNMKACYNFFVEQAYKNRKLIEETITPNDKLLSELVEIIKSGGTVTESSFDEFVKSTR